MKYSQLIGRKVRLQVTEPQGDDTITVLDVTGELHDTWFWHQSDPAFEMTLPWQNEVVIYRMVEGGSWTIGSVDNEPVPPEALDLVMAARDLKSEDGENPEYDRALVELIWSGVTLPSLAHLESDDARAVIEGWLGLS